MDKVQIKQTAQKENRDINELTDLSGALAAPPGARYQQPNRGYGIFKETDRRAAGQAPIFSDGFV
ncbi:MAG: hypothetical protein R6U43_11635 [Candidatus Krumholzibacteriales bacterium]